MPNSFIPRPPGFRLDGLCPVQSVLSVLLAAAKILLVNYNFFTLSTFRAQ